MNPDQMKQMMLAQALQQQSFQPSAPTSPSTGVSPAQGVASAMQGYASGLMQKRRMEMMKGLMGMNNPFQGNGPLQSYQN